MMPIFVAEMRISFEIEIKVSFEKSENDEKRPIEFCGITHTFCAYFSVKKYSIAFTLLVTDQILMTQSTYTNTLIFQKRRVESMEKYEIEELKQLLWKLENEIRETTASLHNINKSIDQYDKYEYVKIS